MVEMLYVKCNIIYSTVNFPIKNALKNVHSRRPFSFSQTETKKATI